MTQILCLLQVKNNLHQSQSEVKYDVMGWVEIFSEFGQKYAKKH
jgi:hypothetical protein